MKQLKLLLFTFFLFQSTLIFSQNWEWGKHVTGTGNIFNQLTAIDANGNIIVAGAKNGLTTFVGTSYTLNATANTPFLAKYNPDGSIAWLVNIGDKDATNTKGLTVDSQGNIIIAGQFRSVNEACVFGSTNTTGTNPTISLTSAGVQDAYLAKYDTNGNLLWAYDIGQGTGDDRAFGVTTDADNNIFVGGYFVSTTFTIRGAAGTLTKTTGNTTGGDAFLVKYSSDGAYQWHHHFSSATYARNLGGIAPAPNNGVYMAIDFTASVTVLGTNPLVSVSAMGNKAVAIFKILQDGTVEWVRVNRGTTTGANIIQGGIFSSDTEGNLYAIGQGNSTLTFEDGAGGNLLSLICNDYDGWLAKYSSQGTLLWANIAGGLTKEMFNAVSYRQGVASVTGYYSAVTYFPTYTDKRDSLTNSGGQDIFLVNYNSDGQYLGSTRLGGSLDDEASSVVITPDGNSVIGTSFKSATLEVPTIGSFTNGGGQDMFLGKHINIHFLPEETPISCNNGNNGALTFTIFGGGEAPYSYSFAKVGGSVIGSGTYSNPVTFQNLDAGTYYVDITDNQTRTIRKYYNLSSPDAISITASIVNVSGCYANQNGEINITVTGGTAPYTYLWDSEDGYGYISTVEDQSNVTAGNYTVTVIDANGCEEQETFTVTQPAKITFTGSVAVNNTSSNPISPNGSITLSVNNLVGPTTYSWEGPNGFTSTNANITDLRGGTYVLTVDDNSGCIVDTMFNLTDDNLLNAFISNFSNPKCKGGSDGSATVTYTNSVGAITIAWSNGQTDVVTATGLSKGDYTVTITDDMGTPSEPADDATVTVPFSIGEPEYPLEVATTVNKATCPNSNNGSILLSVNGWSMPYTYTWSTTDGSGVVDGQKDQSGLTVGTYSVIVSDAYGCEITKNLNLGSEYSSPSITLAASPSNVVIEGTAVTLTASGGSTYEFFIDDVSQGIPSASDNIVISNPVNNTRIKAVGYNTAGCSGESNEITLTVNPPTYTVTFSVTNSANGLPIENAQVTINSDSPILTNSSGVVTANLVNGTYSYTVSASSYNSSNGEFTVNGDVVSVPVALTPIPPTYTVTFTVTNETTGSPIENAQVTINSDSPILTNSSGVVTANLVNGTYSYTVSASSYNSSNGEFTVNGDVVSVPVALTPIPPTYTITFTVTNKTTSSPIENAQVTIASDSPILTNSSGVATAEKANGTYTYTVVATSYYDINGEFTVTDANVDVPIQLTSTGINDNSLDELSVYPNPFSTEIKFTLTDKISRVEISNVLGQKVIDINPLGENSINTQGIPNGIYLVKFTAKNGDTVVRKLLKDSW